MRGRLAFMLRNIIHNMQRKDKIYISIIAGLVLIIAGLLIAFTITKNINKTGKEDTKVSYSSEDNNDKSKMNNNDNADSLKDNGGNEDCGARAEFVISNTWESGGRKYAQIDISVMNNGDRQIDDWVLKFLVDDSTRAEQNWNCDISKENSAENKLALTPVQYNKVIPADNKTQGIGIIISSDEISDITEYELVSSIEGKQYGYKTDIKDIQADNGGNETNEDYNTEDKQYYNEDTDDIKNSGDGEKDNSAYIRNAVGKLHVSGAHLSDENGNYVQLRGVSTHGIAWYPQYINKDAFRTLKDDWNVNVIRLAMYTEEYGGYCNGGDRNALKELIDKGVEYASELGMYVIIDWHILSDANPNQHKGEATAFFSEMASRYAGYDNVIYEICNEPQNSDWNSVIKPYAEDVINSIRQYDKDAVIIVGTNTWSQDVDAVIGNEIDDDNVMYALHFYAGTHKEWIRNKLTAALDAGVPVIVSECSICDASGNGGIDYASATAWMNLLNSRGVGVIAWSLSNKNETSALISPSCDKLSDWNDDELSETGRWFKEQFSY